MLKTKALGVAVHAACALYQHVASVEVVHPRIYIFLLSKLSFIGSKYPEIVDPMLKTKALGVAVHVASALYQHVASIEVRRHPSWP